MLTVSGIVNRHQANVISYLVEENRVLKEQFGGKVPRLNYDQRRRLAAKAKRLGRRALDGFRKDHRALICDRDTKFTPQFKRILLVSGAEVVLTPKHAPNCDAYAERFVLSIKSECLRRMIFFGDRSLRCAISEYVAHYHAERAHQGIGNERIERAGSMGDGAVQCTERLGGLLKCYRRAA